MRTVALGQGSEETSGDVNTGKGSGMWREAGRACRARGAVQAMAWKWDSVGLNGALKVR